MNPNVRRRLWIESVLAAAAAVLAVVTAIVHDWIEAITGLDPDAGSGALEVAVVVALAVAALAGACLALRDLRRLAAE